MGGGGGMQGSNVAHFGGGWLGGRWLDEWVGWGGREGRGSCMKKQQKYEVKKI